MKSFFIPHAHFVPVTVSPGHNYPVTYVLVLAANYGRRVPSNIESWNQPSIIFTEMLRRFRDAGKKKISNTDILVYFVLLNLWLLQYVAKPYHSTYCIFLFIGKLYFVIIFVLFYILRNTVFKLHSGEKKSILSLTCF